MNRVQGRRLLAVVWLVINTILVALGSVYLWDSVLPQWMPKELWDSDIARGSIGLLLLITIGVSPSMHFFPGYRVSRSMRQV